MLVAERQDEILAILREKNAVTVKQLAKETFVSQATIRRDLIKMENAGLIKRSHGGAVITGSSSDESSLIMREVENTPQKKSIAMLAMNFIKNSGCIFLDSSSTSGMIIPHLNGFDYLTVITNGLKNALLLSQTSPANIYITGGNVRNKSSSVVGTDAVDYIEKMHADVTVMSCGGVDLISGITEASIEQSRVKQQMIKNSKLVLLLCDSSKFGKTFIAKTCEPSDVDYILTDKMPSDKFCETFSKSGCKIITP